MSFKKLPDDYTSMALRSASYSVSGISSMKLSAICLIYGSGTCVGSSGCTRHYFASSINVSSVVRLKIFCASSYYDTSRSVGYLYTMNWFLCFATYTPPYLDLSLISCQGFSIVPPHSFTTGFVFSTPKPLALRINVASVGATPALRASSFSGVSFG